VSPRARTTAQAVVTAAALALTGCVAADPKTVASAPVPDVTSWQPSVATTTASPARTPASASPPASAPAPASAPSPAAAPRKIDQRDADAVSAAVLTTMWRIDTTTDRDQRDAVLRAAGWLSPAYLADLRAGSQVGTDAAWTGWAAHRARTEPSLIAGRDQRQPDTATHADRQWRLTVTPIGADGWRGRPLTMTVFVALQRDRRSAPWRVVDVTLR
jgi:hypothetical protein